MLFVPVPHTALVQSVLICNPGAVCAGSSAGSAAFELLCLLPGLCVRTLGAPAAHLPVQTGSMGCAPPWAASNIQTCASYLH